MDTALVSIVLAALFALAFSTRISAHLVGPAGRREPMARYQRRALGALTVALLCLVVTSWLRQRGMATGAAASLAADAAIGVTADTAGAGAHTSSGGMATSLSSGGGLLAFVDALMLGALMLAWSSLRGRPSRDAAGMLGIALGVYCAAVSAHHAALAFGSVSVEGARRLAVVSAAWGVVPSTSGFIALLHYALAPILLAAGIAARDEYASAPEWARDHVLRKLSLATTGIALVYVAFAWTAVTA